MAPALGFEPRTKWLTATYSTAELCRSVNIYSSLCQDRYNRNRKEMAPALGFEPRTKWLTATYSTAELCRSVVTVLNISPKDHFVNSCKQKNCIFFALFCLKSSNPSLLFKFFGKMAPIIFPEPLGRLIFQRHRINMLLKKTDKEVQIVQLGIF